MKIPSNLENYLWGMGIILVAIGTYLTYLLDGDPKTIPDINVLFLGLTLGASKFRSAGTAQLSEVKQEVKDVKTEVKDIGQAVEETSGVRFPSAPRGYAEKTM